MRTFLTKELVFHRKVYKWKTASRHIIWCSTIEFSTIVTLGRSYCESVECNSRYSSCVISYLSIWNNWNNWSRATVAVAKWWRVAVNLDSCRTQGLPHELLATSCQRSSPFVSRSQREQSPRVTNTQVGIGRKNREKDNWSSLSLSTPLLPIVVAPSGLELVPNWTRFWDKHFSSVQWASWCNSCRSSAQNKEKKEAIWCSSF